MHPLVPRIDPRFRTNRYVHRLTPATGVVAHALLQQWLLLVQTAPGARLHSPVAAQQKLFWLVGEQVVVLVALARQTPAAEQVPPCRQPRLQVLPAGLFSTPQALFVQVAR